MDIEPFWGPFIYMQTNCTTPPQPKRLMKPNIPRPTIQSLEVSLPDLMNGSRISVAYADGTAAETWDIPPPAPAVQDRRT